MIPKTLHYMWFGGKPMPRICGGTWMPQSWKSERAKENPELAEHYKKVK